ncbi:MAG: hypothetical protein R6V06_01070 [Kiritimatiellia bacterium]
MEDGEPFAAIVEDYGDQIDEVYFAWPGQPSGRPAIGSHNGGYTPDEIRVQLLNELQLFRKVGIKLDLLLNANCYGEQAISVAFEKAIITILRNLDSRGCKPDIVTTTSMMVARTVKTFFPDIEIRASVNMRIGTIQAMHYLTDLFDSFYLQRDLQRNIRYLGKIRSWCKENGKKLCILANSGCLRFCPCQTFHDNLIAHCAGIEQQNNIAGWNPHLCWNLYKDPVNFSQILKATWIRPEDIDRYAGPDDTVKLATRQHTNPRMVIGAYAKRRYDGNLLDLFEPGFSPAFAPRFIDNTAFPADWSERTSTCNGECESCSYCDTVLKQVMRSF